MDPDARYPYEDQTYTYDELREVVLLGRDRHPAEDRADVDWIVRELLECGCIELGEDEDRTTSQPSDQ